MIANKITAIPQQAFLMETGVVHNDRTPKYKPLRVLKAFINTGRAFLIVPYPICYDEVASGFSIRSSIFNKVIVAMLHVCSTALLIRNATLSSLFIDSLFLKWTFAATMTGWNLFTVTILYTIWFRSSDIISFCNTIDQLSSNCLCARQDLFSSCYRRSVKTWSTVALLYTLILVWALADFWQIYCEQSWQTCTVENVWLRIVDLAYLSIFNVPRNSELNSLGPLDHCLGAAIIALTFYGINVSQFGFFWVTVVSSTVQCLVKDFARRVVTELKPSASELPWVLSRLSEITKSLESCSKAFGLLFCYVCLFMIPVYSIMLSSLYYGSMSIRIMFAFTLFAFLATVFPAASVHSTMSSFLKWIRKACDDAAFEENGSNLTLRVNLMYQELQNGVGLNGVVFLITYGFIGNMCGLLITFAMIYAQFFAQEMAKVDWGFLTESNRTSLE